MAINLDENQKKAVYYDGTKDLVLEAGPGAGKTRVLVERVKFLLNDKKIKPESMLIITFTVKAADELKSRLVEDISIADINKMQISTIHAFCSKLLSEHGVAGLNVINDDYDEQKIMYLRKHKKDLGFTEEATMFGSGLADVITKFDEYATFNVDSNALINYIEENRPVSDEYKEFIQSCKREDGFDFPYDEVKENFKQDWYNAKYLAVAKAYPKYLELLENEGYIDYNQLQYKTLELLQNNEDVRCNLRFKNILIDEFQDTDPIQIQLFDILEENADSFTIVGDDDQSIYGFRGSIPRYFTQFTDNHNAERIVLENNYRSKENIVKFNENFIKSDRINEKNLQAVRKAKTTNFYLENADKQEQAFNISSIIKHLKKTGKIKNYSDVGILFRSVRNISELTNELTYANIPFTLYGKKDLIEYDEIKAILVLIFYMTKDINIQSKWEIDWLNFRAFTNEKYNSQKIFKLSQQSMDIFSHKQDEYEQKVLEIEKEVYKEKTGKASRLKTYAGVFKRDSEIVDEVFNRIEKLDFRCITPELIKSWGLSNEHDIDFFTKLYNLRQDYYDENKKPYERPTILETLYELLNITDFFREKFQNDDVDSEELLAIAQMTNTSRNYEDIISKRDITGFYWYLSSRLDKYVAPTIEDTMDAVQIMTIRDLAKNIL